MFRTARRITPLLHSLLLGTMTAMSVGAAATTLVGCADENSPETHVKRLGEPATRTAAMNRLIQFFEDAMTRDNKDRNGPTVKPLLDKILEPMTTMCVSADLEPATTAKLVKFLSDTRDPRTEACLVKTLKDYKPDSTEENVRWASRAVGALKLKAASGPLLDVFKKVRPSKPKAAAIYRDVHDALIDLADPAWEGELITLLERPIADRSDGNVLRDEGFWQITAAELLGIMKSEKAVKPLIKAIVSPMKADVAMTAVNALIKIGKPAMAPTIALLKSEDKELVDYSKGENLKAGAGPDGKPSAEAIKIAEKAHIGTAAIILATIGRAEATPVLIEAMSGVDDVSRALIARELAKLPKTPESVKAFQAAYEKTPLSLSIPPGQGAREALLDAAATFFDASFVPWIVKTAKDARGEDSDVEPVRASSLLAAMKLMTKEQIPVVDELYALKTTGADGKPSTLGKGFEKEYKAANELLNACGSKTECFLAKLVEPASQAKDTQFQGIKSAYMIGALGTPEVRAKLVESMPKLTNAAVRFVAVSVIDQLSPSGDKAVAEQLQKIVDEAETSKDAAKMSLNAPFKTVIYRLNARAQ
jgi:hypothetical protein